MVATPAAPSLCGIAVPAALLCRPHPSLYCLSAPLFSNPRSQSASRALPPTRHVSSRGGRTIHTSRPHSLQTSNAHLIAYGAPVAKVVPMFVSLDHGATSGLEFVPAIHLVHYV